MVATGYQRKLSAIISADVQGYSRHMGDDESITVQTLTTYRQIINETVSQHRGRVVDFSGDNFLAEFNSVLDAVQCAIEIQKELKIRNALLIPEKQMKFRIGINLGDVIVEEDKIYGEGVNIAARIESLAYAGGICISGEVYEQIKNKLDLKYEYLGEQLVKNISEPIRTYRILLEPAHEHVVIPANKPRYSAKLKGAAFFLSGVLAVVLAVTLGWKFYIAERSEFKHSDSMKKNMSSVTSRSARQSIVPVSQPVSNHSMQVSDEKVHQIISRLESDYQTVLDGHKDLMQKFEQLQKQIQQNKADINDKAYEFGIRYNDMMEKLEKIAAQTNNTSDALSKLTSNINKVRKVKLRDVPEAVTDKEISTMVYKFDFFEMTLNRNGNFINSLIDHKDGTITDDATGLMWEKEGSSIALTYDEAERHIKELNSPRPNKYYYSNWRIPTLEELCSLLEPDKNKWGLYIDPVFEMKRNKCWSSDIKHIGPHDKEVYNVDYEEGQIGASKIPSSRSTGADIPKNYLRAVRAVY